MSVYFAERWAWHFTFVKMVILLAICGFGGVVFYLTMLVGYYVGGIR